MSPVAQADVDRLTTLQEFSRVYAPFAGTITARNVEIGQLLTNGNGASQSLFHLAKTNPVRVFVNVPQIYSPGVKAGLEANLVVREMPGRKFVGKVTRTARAIDPDDAHPADGDSSAERRSCAADRLVCASADEGGPR